MVLVVMGRRVLNVFVNLLFGERIVFMSVLILFISRAIIFA